MVSICAIVRKKILSECHLSLTFLILISYFNSHFLSFTLQYCTICPTSLFMFLYKIHNYYTSLTLGTRGYLKYILTTWHHCVMRSYLIFIDHHHHLPFMRLLLEEHMMSSLWLNGRILLNESIPRLLPPCFLNQYFFKQQMMHIETFSSILV